MQNTKLEKNLKRFIQDVSKDYTHNFKPQEVEMTSKVLREKSNCVVCGNAEVVMKSTTTTIIRLKK